MTFLWYFLCLGAGYILIQVALIQKFVLLLGHPTYALTVIVFSMLVASGVGSYLSGRVIAGDDRRLMRRSGRRRRRWWRSWRSWRRRWSRPRRAGRCRPR